VRAASYACGSKRGDHVLDLRSGECARMNS
jgi:hypothetical protein